MTVPTPSAAPTPEPAEPGGRRGPTAAGPGVSVLIVTRNDASGLRDCLRSWAFSDDVAVLDAGSTDGTVDLAGSFANVTVYQRGFDGWAAHLNWALGNIPFRHPWVYCCGADERSTGALRDELAHAAAAPGAHAAFAASRAAVFMGRELRHGGAGARPEVRLLDPRRVRWREGPGGPSPAVDGPVGALRSRPEWRPFQKGLVWWFYRENVASSLAAEAAAGRPGADVPDRAGFLSFAEAFGTPPAKDPGGALSAWALGRFFSRYALRLGFLDGVAGFHYAAMAAMAEYWAGLKIGESRRPSGLATEGTVARMLGGVGGATGGAR